MSELIEENKPLDPLTVSEKLDNKNSLNKVGGKDYLIELATSTPSAANLEAYAEIFSWVSAPFAADVRCESFPYKITNVLTSARDLHKNAALKSRVNLRCERTQKLSFDSMSPAGRTKCKPPET